MVEFSDRWDVELWLRGKPREVSVVIAARAALRVAPLILRLRKGRGRLNKSDSAIFLSLFRGMAASWVRAAWPTNDVELAFRASTASADIAELSGDEVVVAISYAADAAVRGAADRAADSAARAAAAAALAAADATADIWSAISSDATELESKNALRPVDLAIQAVWPTEIPAWVKGNWTKLRSALLKANEDWDVWVDWYEARLYGANAGFLPRASLEVARVTIEEDVWGQDPKIVNAHIKRLIEEFEKKEEREIFSDAVDDQADVAVQIQVPSIPAPRRAAVEPVWQNGQLTVPSRPIAVDLQQNEFPTALRALRAGLQKFADDLDGEANIDRRFVAYLRHLAEQMPDEIPPQHELFELGHAEEVFIKYAPKVNEQWPEFLAARFHAMVRQHDNTMRQAPAWRDFKRNALRDTITQQQVVEVAPITAQITGALRDDEARPFIGAPLPKALDALAEPLRRPPPDDAREEWRHAIEAGNELLALDVIESINNTLKRIAEVALATGTSLGEAAGIFTTKLKEGIREGLTEEGHKYGKRIVKWLCAGGAAGVSILLQKLITTYPDAFGWLGAVVSFLSRLHLP